MILKNKKDGKEFIISLGIIISYLLWSTFIQVPLNLLSIHNNKLISVYEIILNSLYIFIIYLVYKKDIDKSIDRTIIDKKKSSIIILISILAIFFIMLSVNILSFIITRKINIPNNDLTITHSISKNFIISCFYLILYSPIIEELIFRQNLRKAFNNDIVFILVSSILIGIFYLIYNNLNIFFISYYLVGLFLSFLYSKTNNIILNIIARVIYNLILLALVVL